MSLTHGYCLWKGFQARLYLLTLGLLQWRPGHCWPRVCSNETSGRMPCARAAWSHSSRRDGSVEIEFQGVTRRAYLSRRTWKSGSAKVVACWSDMPIAGSLPFGFSDFSVSDAAMALIRPSASVTTTSRRSVWLLTFFSFL